MQIGNSAWFWDGDMDSLDLVLRNGVVTDLVVDESDGQVYGDVIMDDGISMVIFVPEDTMFSTMMEADVKDSYNKSLTRFIDDLEAIIKDDANELFDKNELRNAINRLATKFKSK